MHRSSKDGTREVAQWTPELVVTSPVPECNIGIDTLSNWQNTHIRFLTRGVRAIMVRKDKCKSVELHLPRKRVKPKVIAHFWRDFRD